MNVMVTGGAGYIGSHAVKQLIEAGNKVVVIDNLCKGHRKAVHEDARFELVDLAETDRIAQILTECQVECVMHFAALTSVAESVELPLSYYENNTAGAISLLRAMETAGVRRFVFSSTAATYGSVEGEPIVETTPQQPINPYGWSKWCVERILLDYTAANPDFAFVALRYFNVAGAAADGSLGETHDPETHLIPLILFAAQGKRDVISIFGTDYPTEDGTCIRDYIHVEDLCAAHILAMKALEPGDTRFYNLGIGHGYSVREVIESARRVTGLDIPVVETDRRAGDPAILFACPDKVKAELGFDPKYTEIDEIVATAWNWYRDK